MGDSKQSCPPCTSASGFRGLAIQYYSGLGATCIRGVPLTTAAVEHYESRTKTRNPRPSNIYPQLYYSKVPNWAGKPRTWQLCTKLRHVQVS